MTRHRSGEWCEGWGRSRSGCRDIDMPASHTHLHVTSWVLCCQTPIHHLQQATHTFPCLRWLGDGATAPPFASPYIAAEKTTDTSDQDKMVGEIFSFVCLVCVLCTKRGPPFFAGRCGGGGRGRKGGERGKKTPSVMRFVFLFRPGSSGISRNKRKTPLKKKGSIHRLPYQTPLLCSPRYTKAPPPCHPSTHGSYAPSFAVLLL